MSMFRRKEREIPGLNTASLPDLIFTVLFFFMIVTHMRKVELKVKYRVPEGTELTKLTKKTTVSYIYIGQPTPALQKKIGSAPRIQLNDKIARADEIGQYIRKERSRMDAADRKKMTVSIKADRSTPMSVVSDVKQALRRADALNISYSATQKAR